MSALASTLNELSGDVSFKTIKHTDLTQGTRYPVKKFQYIKTVHGSRLVAELEEGRLFLPRRVLEGLSSKQLHELEENEENVISIEYLGVKVFKEGDNPTPLYRFH